MANNGGGGGGGGGEGGGGGGGGLSLDDIRAYAEGARQHSYQMLVFNMEQAQDGVTVDSYSKVVNNTVNKPDKIVATQ